MYSDLRILALQLDDYGCGHYRIKLPVQTLMKYGAEVTRLECWKRTFSPERLPDLGQFTHILVQRQADLRLLVRMKEAQEKGVTVLYEVDDNLHKIPTSNYAHRFFKQHSERLRNCETFMRECDGLLLSTPDLAAQYSHLNKKIWVVPNYIDFHIRDWDSPVERHEKLKDKLVIGWAGGHTHQQDYQCMGTALKEVLEKYEHVVLALCSSIPMMREFIKNTQVSPDKVVCLNPVPFQQYPKVIAQFDIGIAPLQDCTFNRAKSWLKIMEYAARGIPYVATDIAPYRRYQESTGGFGGFLARGQRDWLSHLDGLINESECRQLASSFNHTITRERFNLDIQHHEWANALRKARQGNILTTWVPAEKPGRNDPCPCLSGKKYKKCCIPAFG